MLRLRCLSSDAYSLGWQSRVSENEESQSYGRQTQMQQILEQRTIPKERPLVWNLRRTHVCRGGLTWGKLQAAGRLRHLNLKIYHSMFDLNRKTWGDPQSVENAIGRLHRPFCAVSALIKNKTQKNNTNHEVLRKSELRTHKTIDFESGSWLQDTSAIIKLVNKKTKRIWQFMLRWKIAPQFSIHVWHLPILRCFEVPKPGQPDRKTSQ